MYKARNPCKRLESDCNDIGSKYIESNSRSGCRGSRGRRIAIVRLRDIIMSQGRDLFVS